jgi:hypothetical protein
LDLKVAKNLSMYPAPTRLARFSIAGPTGEGVTTPLTFTRERRCSMIDDLWILGRG